jgi:predicted RND superfamily exporter protein
MWLLGISFNSLTATILAITLGVGIDYTVHLTHRAVEELDRTGDGDTALERTLRGTGGALTGSMVTDVLVVWDPLDQPTPTETP